MILKKGTRLFRGGKCKGNFFTTDSRVAKLYGKLCTFTTKKKLNLFVVTHKSIKDSLKYLTENTQILMSFIFGTGIRKKNQEIVIRAINKSISVKKSKTGRTPGRRLSIAELDSITLRSFYKEFLAKRGYDGMYMPKKPTGNGDIFHSEIYLPNMNNLICPNMYNIPSLFIRYTKGTTRLMRPYPNVFVPYLAGGMAIKIYLKARGIKTAKTSDFDFKFAVPTSLIGKEINKRSELMKNIMESHVAGFVRFLNRMNIKSTYVVRELLGVPTSKPGGPTYKKVYKVYTFYIVTPGAVHDLVDTSLVVVPGIRRETHISKKWTQVFRFPIQNLTHMWKDTLYVLAGSFVKKDILLRNPINGDKKEKGIKNAIRVGHLSYLTSKRKKSRRLVSLARKLIDDVVLRDKRSGVIHSKKILKLL